MFNFESLKKIPKLAELAPEAMQGFKDLDKAAKLPKIIMSGLEGAILINRVDGGLERLKAQRELIHCLVG